MFPLDNPVLLRKWIIAVRRAKWQPTKYSRLCSDHFSLSSYKTYAKRYLRDDAVPSIFNFSNQSKKCRGKQKPIIIKCAIPENDCDSLEPNNQQPTLLQSRIERSCSSVVNYPVALLSAANENSANNGLISQISHQRPSLDLSSSTKKNGPTKIELKDLLQSSIKRNCSSGLNYPVTLSSAANENLVNNGWTLQISLQRSSSDRSSITKKNGPPKIELKGPLQSNFERSCNSVVNDFVALLSATKENSVNNGFISQTSNQTPSLDLSSSTKKKDLMKIELKDLLQSSIESSCSLVVNDPVALLSSATGENSVNNGLISQTSNQTPSVDLSSSTKKKDLMKIKLKDLLQSSIESSCSSLVNDPVALLSSATGENSINNSLINQTSHQTPLLDLSTNTKKKGPTKIALKREVKILQQKLNRRAKKIKYLEMLLNAAKKNCE